MIKVLDEICAPGNIVNEDYICYGKDYAVLMDGSTSLIKSDLDAVWFTHKYMEFFEEELKETRDLISSINNSTIRMKDLFYSLADEEVTSNDGFNIYPSASACFVYEHEDDVHFCSIGDSNIKIYLKDGNIVHLTSDEVKKLDNEVINRAVELRKDTGKDILDLIKDDELHGKLIENRKKMNAPNGYKILSINMDPIGPDEIVSFKAEAIDHILMYSDGFENVEYMFGEKTSLENILKTLRETEDKDVMCNEIPRLKKNDDAAAIVMKLV